MAKIKVDGANHVVKKNKKGEIIVDHAASAKAGKYDKINLTKKAGSKTVKEGEKVTRAWHKKIKHMGNEITCLNLWKAWVADEPENPQVLEAQERIKQYSKENWAEMAEEATVMVSDMGNKVKNNLGEFTEEDFDRLCAHLEDWFFKVDKVVIDRLGFVSIFSPDYVSFLNKYADGLNLYVYRMCRKYVYKVTDR